MKRSRNRKRDKKEAGVSNHLLLFYLYSTSRSATALLCDSFYPTTFRMKEGTEELDDPFGQAEYAYSLIEMEVNKNGSQ